MDEPCWLGEGFSILLVGYREGVSWGVSLGVFRIFFNWSEVVGSGGAFGGGFFHFF